MRTRAPEVIAGRVSAAGASSSDGFSVRRPSPDWPGDGSEYTITFAEPFRLLACTISTNGGPGGETHRNVIALSYGDNAVTVILDGDGPFSFIAVGR